MRWQSPISSQRNVAHYMPYHDGQRLVTPLCGNGPFNTGFARVLADAPFCARCQSRLAAMERA